MKSKGVLAFCGSKGAGKDTSFELFSQISGFEIEQVALAGHLKKVSSEAFNIDMKYFTDPELKEVELENYIVLDMDNLSTVLKAFGVEDISYYNNLRPHVARVFRTPRSLLQYIGTEVLHPIDPLIHSKIAMSNKDPNKLTVVTDLRFENEFEYLNETLNGDFTPVYVKNSRAEIAASTDLHPSERQLELFKNKCYLLNNEGTLEDLKGEIAKFIEVSYSKEANNATIGTSQEHN